MKKKVKKEKKDKTSVRSKNKNLINININSNNKRKASSKAPPRNPPVFISQPFVPYLPQDSSISQLYPIIQNLTEKVHNISSSAPPLTVSSHPPKQSKISFAEQFDKYTDKEVADILEKELKRQTSELNEIKKNSYIYDSSSSSDSAKTLKMTTPRKSRQTSFNHPIDNYYSSSSSTFSRPRTI